MPTILLAEDDAMNRDMFERRLAWEGFAVVTARNGREALEVALRILPAVILMDIGMPVMDGWQATRELKRRPETRHIPVIALTAYSAPEDRAACLEAGCDDVMIKPVDFDQLKLKLRALLGG